MKRNGSILVTGSTGHVGYSLVKLLQGQRVLAARRKVNDAAASAQHHEGVTPVAFDYTNPATWEAALDGVDRVFLLHPPGDVAVDRTVSPFVERAARTGCQFVVMTAAGVEFSEEAPLRKVERLVESTGNPHVFLRPTWFLDNFHTFWLTPIREEGVIPLPAGDSKTAFVSAADIARCAAAVLTQSEWDGQAFTLTGPKALTYAEAAAVLSRHAQREIRYRNVDDATFVAMLESAGLPGDYARYLALLFSFVRQGAAAQVTDSVPRLTGRAAESIEEYAARNATAWRVE